MGSPDLKRLEAMSQLPYQFQTMVQSFPVLAKVGNWMHRANILGRRVRDLNRLRSKQSPFMRFSNGHLTCPASFSCLLASSAPPT